jgi:hypothetical protein
MQERELNYPTSKGQVYSEEEDRHSLYRLNYYGMMASDVYECIKKDITQYVAGDDREGGGGEGEPGLGDQNERVRVIK